MPIKTLLALCVYVSIGMPAAAGYVVVLGYDDDVVYVRAYTQHCNVLTRTARIELCFIMIPIRKFMLCDVH